MSRKDVSIEIIKLIEEFEKSENVRDLEFKKRLVNSTDEDDKVDRVLIWLSQMGDERAREIFILDKMDYVRKVTRCDNEILAYKSRGLDEDDLFQTAMLGVFATIDKYDFRDNVKVSTFLTNNIRYSIKNAYRTYGMISVSREASSIYNKFSGMVDVIDDKVKTDVIKDIVCKYNLSEKKIMDSIMAIKVRNNVCEIKSDGTFDCDTVSYEKYKNRLRDEFQEKMNKHIDFMAILDSMNKLSSKEYYIIKSVFIDDRTQKELSRELDISVTAVGKIKNRAISKIKIDLSKE